MSAAGERIGGTVVVRDRRVVYASTGVAELVGRHPHDLLGLSLLELLAPEARARVGERLERQQRGEPVPSEYPIDLLARDGTRRSVEAQFTLEGPGEVVIRLRDGADRASRRDRLAGVAELGVALQRERGEAGLFERVREGLHDLGLDSLLLLAEPQGLRIGWLRTDPLGAAALARRIGRPPEGTVVPWSALCRAAWEQGAAFTDDWAPQLQDLLGAPADPGPAPAAPRPRGLVLRLDERSVPTRLLAVTGAWLEADDAAALRLFAAQLAAALDSARAIGELSARNVELAALNRLGEQAGTALGLADQLREAAEVVRASSGCDAVAVFGADPEGRQLRVLHATGAPAGFEARWGQVPFESGLGSAVASRRLQVVQVEAMRPEPRTWLERSGFATFAFVPLVLHSRVVGAMVTAWRAARPAEACRAELLMAMGSHFAAAIESHGLLGDLRRRVAELTLLNDVAMATLDPEQLLQDVLRRMGDTFEVDAGLAFLLEDGALQQRGALGLSPEACRQLDRLEPGEGLPGLAMAQQRPVTEGPEAALGARWVTAAAREGLRALVAVPLLAGAQPVGALCLARRRARPFDPLAVRLLASLGVQLGLAVEAARHHASTERRARDLEAVHALALRVFASAPGDAPRLLQEACAEIAAAFSARQAVVMLLEDGERTLRTVAVHGDPVPDQLRTLPLERSRLALEALQAGLPVATPDTASDPRGAMFGVAGLAMLAVPLAARGRRRGVIFVGDRAGRRFGEADLALATALGAELALALENAEVHGQALAANAGLRRANERNRRQERLAALGEFSAVVAHEVRNPLGVIFNALGSLRRLLQPTGDARLLIDIIGEESDRLNRMVGDLLDFARPTRPQLQPERLERVVDDAVSAALLGPPGSVEVLRQVEPGLPPVPLDARLVRQALLNVATNALQAMPRGGRLTVRVRAEAEALVVELEDTGGGIREDVRARIFEPFFTTKATGTGLGLAVVKRIVEEHGGEVAVETRPGEGTRFALRFPLRPEPQGGELETAAGIG